MRRKTYFSEALRIRGESIELLCGIPATEGNVGALGTQALKTAVASALAGDFAAASYCEAIASAASPAPGGPKGFDRMWTLRSHLRKVRALQSGEAPVPAEAEGAPVPGGGLFSPADLAGVKLPLPKALFERCEAEGRPLTVALLEPRRAGRGPAELRDALFALAKSGALLGLRGIPRDAQRHGPRAFLLYLAGDGDADLSTARGLRCRLFPVLRPGKKRPPRLSKVVLTSPLSAGTSASAAAGPGSDGEERAAGIRRHVRFPIGLKLTSVVAVLLALSLSTMIVLASYFFLQDATVRVEEGNHTLSQIAAVKVEDDIRALLSRSRLLLDLGGGAAGGEMVRRFYAENPDMLYVGIPGLVELPNRAALDLAGIDPERVSRLAAAQPHPAGGVEAFNGSPDLGMAVLGITVPYKDGDFSGALTVLASSERYSDVLKPRGIARTFVADASGELLLHADQSLLGAGVDYGAHPLLDQFRRSPVDNGQGRYVDTDGQEYLGSYRRVSIADLGVFTVVPVGAAFEAVDAIQRRNLYIMGAVLAAAMMLSYFFSKTLTGPVGDLMGAALRVERGDFRIQMVPRTRDELGALTETFVEMGRGLAEREKIKDAFGKFVNKSVAEKVLKDEIRLGGERREATVFFSDIRSFTAISETLQPEQVVEFLNEYMTRMVRCVDASGGVVDKFIGDAIMAVWGVPVSTGRDAAAGVEAALAMRRSLMEYNRGRGGPGKPVIKIGCGLNSGPVLAGQIGSTERMEYTVIGDAVNLASRIEALNKPLGTDILVSDNTLALLGDAFATEPLQKIQVKGKSEPIRVHAVIRRRDDPAGPRDLKDLRDLLGIPQIQVDPDATAGDEEKKYKLLPASGSGSR